MAQSIYRSYLYFGCKLPSVLIEQSHKAAAAVRRTDLMTLAVITSKRMGEHGTLTSLLNLFD
jgi:hypothetical protein